MIDTGYPVRNRCARRRAGDDAHALRLFIDARAIEMRGAQAATKDEDGKVRTAAKRQQWTIMARQVAAHRCLWALEDGASGDHASLYAEWANDPDADVRWLGARLASGDYAALAR
jgi:hypothetical protein